MQKTTEELEQAPVSVRNELLRAQMEVRAWAEKFCKQQGDLDQSLVGAMARGIANDMVDLVQHLWDDMTQEDWDNWTYDCPPTMAMYYESWEVLKWLLNNGYGWECDNEECTYGLVAALEHNRVDVAVALLESMDGGVNFKDNEGYTALTRAVEESTPVVVRALLLLGADPRVKGIDDSTALDMATNPDIRMILALALAKQP